MGIFNRTTFAFIAAGCAYLAQAQTMTANLTGTVLDAKTGAPVVGAAVSLVFNSSVTSTTDAQGKFTLAGQVTGIGEKPLSSRRSGMVLDRGAIRLDVAAEAPVSVAVYGLDSRRVKTLVASRLAAGQYSITSPVADLPAGIYLVRGSIGRQAISVKASSMGIAGVSSFGAAAPLFARLAKQAAEVVDTVKVTKAGYRKLNRAITRYEGILELDMTPGLPPGDLKIVSERNFPQVAWGSNVDVQVWDGGTQLKGDYAPLPFEGTQSWKITFGTTQTYNAWGFVANVTPEDMSSWAAGHMHIAIKGTAKTVGVNMASADQISGTALVVDGTKYGYKPDNEWHELRIPSADFVGVDFSQISVYLGLSVPDTVFNADDFYLVDDVYWKTTAP